MLAEIPETWVSFNFYIIVPFQNTRNIYVFIRSINHLVAVVLSCILFMWSEISVYFLAFTLRTNSLLATNKANLCIFIARSFSHVYVLNQSHTTTAVSVHSQLHISAQTASGHQAFHKRWYRKKIYASILECNYILVS